MVLNDFFRYALQHREDINVYLTTATKLTGQVIAHDSENVVIARCERGTPGVQVVARHQITTSSFVSPTASLTYWSNYLTSNGSHTQIGGGL